MLETPINRQYVRTCSWSVTASVNKDGAQHCIDAPVLDIAAGGLLFLTDRSYEKGDILRFDLKIDPMSPAIPRKITMRVKGEITSDRGMKYGRHAYSVKFTEISTSDRIRIDELIHMTNYKCRIDTESDFLDV